jgi:hypothetical protein
LTKNDHGDDGIWKVIADEVHRDADRLFKIIGEAYAVLSDPAKVFYIFSNNKVDEMTVLHGFTNVGFCWSPMASFVPWSQSREVLLVVDKNL